MLDKNPFLTETEAHVESVLDSKSDSLLVRKAAFGLFFNVAKPHDGNGGLCFTPVKKMPLEMYRPSSAQAMPLSGKLLGRPVRQYLEDLSDPNLKKKLSIASLGGILVTKLDELLDVVSEGGTGYHFFGKSPERLVIKPIPDQRP